MLEEVLHPYKLTKLSNVYTLLFQELYVLHPYELTKLSNEP